MKIAACTILLLCGASVPPGAGGASFAASHAGWGATLMMARAPGCSIVPGRSVFGSVTAAIADAMHLSAAEEAAISWETPLHSGPNPIAFHLEEIGARIELYLGVEVTEWGSTVGDLVEHLERRLKEGC